MKIQSTKNASNDRLKMVVVAESGNGKTFQATTIGEPLLFISVESGHLTLKDFDIPMVDITTDDNGELLDDRQRYERLLDVYRELKTAESRKLYKWIYIDGITEIANIVIRMLEENEAFSGHSKLLKRYGEYTNIMSKIILMFRDLPYYNVVFTALAEEKVDKDKKTGDVLKRYPLTVLMPGTKIPENVPAYFDEVLYLGCQTEKDGEKKRYFLTEATSKALAKDRSGRLEKFEKPNLGEIAKKIKGVKK